MLQARIHGVRLRRNVKSHYIFKERIGSGTHGVVHLAVERSTGLHRAVKKIRKKPGLNIDRFMRELEVLLLFRHPQIVKVYEAFEDSSAIYIIMEFCKGGDLCDRLETEGAFPESAAAYFMRQALGAVSMCHDNGIMHRDIKLENFLFTNRDARSPLKLTDFGLCRYFDDKSDPPSLVGTINYLAPEVLDLHYDHSADLWSLGVLMYMLILDDFPFGRAAHSETEVLREIKNGVIQFFEGPNGMPSPLAQDLIRSLCQMNPAARISARQALKHPWIAGLSPPLLHYLPLVFSVAQFSAPAVEDDGAKSAFEEIPRAATTAAAAMPCPEVLGVTKMRDDHDLVDNTPRTGLRPTIQQFLQTVQNESVKSSTRNELTLPPTDHAGLRAPFIGRSSSHPRSSPSMSQSQERSKAIAEELHQDVTATSSASSFAVRASEPALDSKNATVRGWRSAVSLEQRRPSAFDAFGCHLFCCDMLELCARHSRRCSKAVSDPSSRRSVGSSPRACTTIGESLICDVRRRVTCAIFRLGINSAESANALGWRLLDRWKAYKHLTPTERNLLSMIARQMDSTELRYFCWLYSLLDCDQTGNVCVEPLARAVAYLCGCPSLVCHGFASPAQILVAAASVPEICGASIGGTVSEAKCLLGREGSLYDGLHNMGTLGSYTPFRKSTCPTPPVSPATTVPHPLDRADDQSAADLYANDLSYVSGEMQICESCTSSQAFAAYVQVLDEIRMLLHSHVDLNHNGKIEVDEFCAACMDQLLVLKPVASKILFKSLNVSQAPSVTVDDFTSAFAAKDAPDLTLIHNVDPNGDGLIEETDLEALLSESAACLSRNSVTRLCEQTLPSEAGSVLDADHPKDSLDFRPLLPKMKPAR